MLSCPLIGPRRANQRKIVALCPTGGEEYLFILHLPDLCQSLFRLFYILLRFHAFRVPGRRVSIIFAHDLSHQFAHAVIRPGGGGIVQIDFFHAFHFLFLYSYY